MPDNWNEYRIHVIKSLENIEEKLERMGDDITTLKVKAAMGGFVGGGIAGALWMAFEKLHG